MKKKKTKNGGKKLSTEFKLDVVRSYYLGVQSQQQIATEFGIGQQTVSRIIRNFASENEKSALLMGKVTKDSQSEELKALRKEVLDLKKQLYNERMRADFNDTMIDVAEEMFGIEIRKKAVTGQSKGCTGRKDTK